MDNTFIQQKLIPRLTFNPGLALTGFRTTRPWTLLSPARVEPLYGAGRKESSGTGLAVARFPSPPLPSPPYTELSDSFASPRQDVGAERLYYFVAFGSHSAKFSFGMGNVSKGLWNIGNTFLIILKPFVWLIRNRHSMKC